MGTGLRVDSGSATYDALRSGLYDTPDVTKIDVEQPLRQFFERSSLLHICYNVTTARSDYRILVMLRALLKHV